MAKTYISTKTAAEEIDVAIRTVQEWCKQKKLEAKKMGNDWRIERAVWEDYKARILKAA